MIIHLSSQANCTNTYLPIHVMKALWYNWKSFSYRMKFEDKIFFWVLVKLFPYIIQPWCIASLQYILNTSHILMCFVLLWFSHHLQWIHVEHLHIFFKVALWAMGAITLLPQSQWDREISLKDMYNIDLHQNTSKYKALIQCITKRTRTPVFWWYTPAAPWIPILWFPSQNKTKSKLQIKKNAKTSNIWDLKKNTLHAAHLENKICRYEMHLAFIVEDTEQARLCTQMERWTNGQTYRQISKMKPL